MYKKHTVGDCKGTAAGGSPVSHRLERRLMQMPAVGRVKLKYATSVIVLELQIVITIKSRLCCFLYAHQKLHVALCCWALVR